MLLRLRFCCYYFVWNRYALLFYYKHQQHTLGNAHRRREEYIKKFLFSIYDFLKYFLKNERLLPSIGDMRGSTLMLLELSLDNKWSNVNVSVNKFWSRHLSRVNRTLSVVCKVTETASASTGIVGKWCSHVFFFKVKESIMIR